MEKLCSHIGSFPERKEYPELENIMYSCTAEHSLYLMLPSHFSRLVIVLKIDTRWPIQISENGNIDSTKYSSFKVSLEGTLA